LETNRKNILVAPLNWGLGHATRCIPIIRELQKNRFNVIIASDGPALKLLQKEFPEVPAVTLPSYDIQYAQNGDDFKWKFMMNSPKLLLAIIAENKRVKELVEKYDLNGIISDNRFGVYSKQIPSVFITHQLKVLSGDTTWISSKIHQLFIKKFSICWVPDLQEKPNLTGKMGHLKTTDIPLEYLGPISRFEKRATTKRYALMIILSGPEPQRTLLETILTREIQQYDGAVIFIKGVVESDQKMSQDRHITYYNFMTSQELEEAFNASEIVVCRSGYTTVMDLAKLQKKAFFIPTPGQFEQEYLAKKMKRSGFVPFAKQHDFKIENLLEVGLYKGLPSLQKEVDWVTLFKLFEGK